MAVPLTATQQSLSLQELVKAIGGLLAHDRGMGTGIQDPQLKAHIRQVLRSMSDDERRQTIAHVAIELFLSDDAVKTSCGLEDAAALWEWLVFNRMV